MSLFGGLTFVIVIAMIAPGLRAACINCNDEIDYSCNATSTGFYCVKGAKIYRVTDAIYNNKPHILYPGCEPPRVIIEFVSHYCCVYSPENGCQVAVNYQSNNYETVPEKFCNLCKNKCRCGNFRADSDGANIMQICHWSCLCAIVLLIWRGLT